MLKACGLTTGFRVALLHLLVLLQPPVPFPPSRPLPPAGFLLLLLETLLCLFDPTPHSRPACALCSTVVPFCKTHLGCVFFSRAVDILLRAPQVGGASGVFILIPACVSDTLFQVTGVLSLHSAVRFAVSSHRHTALGSGLVLCTCHSC